MPAFRALSSSSRTAISCKRFHGTSLIITICLAILVVYQVSMLWGDKLDDVALVLEVEQPKQRKHPGFYTKFTWVDLLNKASKKNLAEGKKEDPYYCKNPRVASEQYRSWSGLVASMPICKLAWTLCNRVIPPKAYGPLVAGAKMYNEILPGTPSVWVALIAVICTLFGLMTSKRSGSTESAILTNPSNKTSSPVLDTTTVDEEECTDTSREPNKGFKRVVHNTSINNDGNNLNAPDAASTKSSLQIPEDDDKKIRAKDVTLQQAFVETKRSLMKLWLTTNMSRMERNMTAWWLEGPTFSRPTVTFKLFIMVLMVSELLFWHAPDISSYSTPELIAISHRLPPVDSFVPSVSHWLMPDLNEETVDNWITRLEWIRIVHLSSWCLFLALPIAYGRTAGFVYTIGAITYCVLGAIAVTYEHLHTISGCMGFVLGACLAVPSLETNPRSAIWLRQFLLVTILVPSYLFAGISKIRYDGIRVQLTGSWFPNKVRPARSLLPTVLQLIKDYPILQSFMSWGNLVVELILPLLVIWKHRVMPLRTLFHCSEILFHVSILLLMGPNFLRHCLLHILAMNPLGLWCTTRPTKSETSRSDRMRILFGMLLLAEAFRVQFASDTRSVFGKAGRGNPYLPYPEYSMFVKKQNQIGTWYQSFVLDVLSLGLYLVQMVLLGE